MSGIDTQPLTDARLQLSDVLEEIGAVATALREAGDFAESHSIPAAVASVDDAQEAIDRAIQELTKIRDRAGRWAVWAEGKEAGS
jgi:hypothetical protein